MRVIRSEHTGEVVSSHSPHNSLLRSESIASASASITPTSPCENHMTITYYYLMYMYIYNFIVGSGFGLEDESLMNKSCEIKNNNLMTPSEVARRVVSQSYYHTIIIYLHSITCIS